MCYKRHLCQKKVTRLDFPNLWSWFINRATPGFEIRHISKWRGFITSTFISKVFQRKIEKWKEKCQCLVVLHLTHWRQNKKTGQNFFFEIQIRHLKSNHISVQLSSFCFDHHGGPKNTVIHNNISQYRLHCARSLLRTIR